MIVFLKKWSLRSKTDTPQQCDVSQSKKRKESELPLSEDRGFRLQRGQLAFGETNTNSTGIIQGCPRPGNIQNVDCRVNIAVIVGAAIGANPIAVV